MKDHPRVCGEHRCSFHNLLALAGSSPRMRGTPLICFLMSANAGIIPAYAGNTSQCAALRALLRDHPRVCGEHLYRPFSGGYSRGSSPRMRGTRKEVSDEPKGLGIIPAYAGNTMDLIRAMAVLRDHPRVCGEHVRLSSPSSRESGSSPRMRGTPREGAYGKAIDGIIPAYAGNTRFCPSLSKRSRDHPRVCGEHRPSGWIALVMSGSSPRMRGTRRIFRLVSSRMGIIPAYAGNTGLQWP